jgi:ATP-dependent protease ClpP protease subunit
MKKFLSMLFIASLVLGGSLSIKKEEKLVGAFDVEIGAVQYFNAERVLNDFKKAEISNRVDKVIDMAINSGGGGVHLGLEFIEEMKSLKAKGYKINCWVRNAYSMGFIILQYCDKRIGSENSTYMHHLVQVGFGRPKRTEHNKKLFKALDFFDKLVLDEISKRMKVDPKKFFEIYKDDKWWDAKEALKANIIDEIKPFSLFKRKIKYKFVPFWRRF